MAKERRTPLYGVPLISGAPIISSGRGRARNMRDEMTPPPTLTMDVDSRVAVLEAREVESRLEIRERLAQGAETFGEIRLAFGKLTDRFSEELQKVEAHTKEETEKLTMAIATMAPKPLSGVRLLMYILPALVFIAGLVWAASRYPERSEFLDLQHRVNDLHDVTRDTANDVKGLREQIRDLAARKAP